MARARFKSPTDLKDYYDKSKYRSESRAYPAPGEMAQVAKLLDKAERPLIVAGQGVFQRQGWEALARVAQRNEIAVATSGPTRGAFPMIIPCV